MFEGMASFNLVEHQYGETFKPKEGQGRICESAVSPSSPTQNQGWVPLSTCLYRSTVAIVLEACRYARLCGGRTIHHNA